MTSTRSEPTLTYLAETLISVALGCDAMGAPLGGYLSANDQGKKVPREKMKAIIVTEQAPGMAGMKLVARPEPPAAINDVIGGDIQKWSARLIRTGGTGPPTV